MENKKTYLVYDLGCTAALITGRCNLINLDRTNPKRIGFIFEYTDSFKSSLNNYWSNHFEVDARTLVENMKMLKTRIYSEK